MNTIASSLLSVCVALAAFVEPAIAAPGDLDLNFGGTGKVTTDLAGGSGDDYGYCVAVQSDGKIVVAGSSPDPSGTSVFAVARYNPNGSLDTSFAGAGKVTTLIGSESIAQGVAVQNDGKIVVAGYAAINSRYEFVVARYNNDGTFDTNFNSTGFVATALSSSSAYAHSVALQSDGKIVVAGNNSTGGSFAVVRYTTGGILDTNFGTSGTVVTGINATSGRGSSVVVQSDGKIVVAGYGYNSANDDFWVVRYNSNGTLDTAFGGGTGKVTTAFVNNGNDRCYGLALQSDGKIVVAGSSYNTSTGFNEIAVVRYATNGSLDLRFTTALGNRNDQASALALQSDGKIVVAGYSDIGTSSVANNDFTLLRYNTNGTLDTSFGSGGKLTTSIETSHDIASAVALQSDGKIVVAGYTVNSSNNYDFALARFLGDGPEIVVEQPAGASLTDGVSVVAFGNVLVGNPVSYTFTIKNIGFNNLTGIGVTINGSDASNFSVTTSPAVSVSGGSSTTFVVRFAPAFPGPKTAALHITSNDSDESPFDISLSGRAFDPNADDDGDGVSNAAELNLASLGFDPLINNSNLVTTVRSNGFYRASDVQTLALGSPLLLARDSTNGYFHLSIGVEKSPNLTNWMPLINFTPTYNTTNGRIELDFPPDASNAQFYRVLGAKP